MDSYMDVISELKDLGFFGAALTVTVASFSLYIKTSRENQRIYRRVLYYLLEIWHAARVIRLNETFNARDFMDTIHNETESYFQYSIQDPESKSIPEELARHLQHQVNDGAETYGYQHLDELQSEYRNALHSLTEIDPKLAFRLSNRAGYGVLANQIRTYLAGVAEVVSQFDSQAKEIIQPIFQKKLEEELSTAIHDLEEDIRHTSRAVGQFFALYMTYWVWKQKRVQNISNQSISDTQDVVAGILPEVMAQVQKSINKREHETADTGK
ncbi:hypothetical protein [Endozoicomonas ascidiicola]|uniref:hypothetical protein n=1 Tax=Endozoicomonas ascidiicola TaxID=1698521 RepID=UPI00082F604F|nr:hypothetical protein [Endozoicomonas ascidiicola]